MAYDIYQLYHLFEDGLQGTDGEGHDGHIHHVLGFDFVNMIIEALNGMAVNVIYLIFGFYIMNLEVFMNTNLTSKEDIMK